jgi:hypothetical protein
MYSGWPLESQVAQTISETAALALLNEPNIPAAVPAAIPASTSRRVIPEPAIMPSSGWYWIATSVVRLERNGHNRT